MSKWVVKVRETGWLWVRMWMKRRGEEGGRRGYELFEGRRGKMANNKGLEWKRE